MRKLIFCLSLLLAFAMLFSGCGTETPALSDDTTSTASKADVALKGDVTISKPQSTD